MKISGGGANGEATNGFFLRRTVSSNGAPNGNAVILDTNSATGTNAATGACVQIISYTNSTVYGPTLPANLNYTSQTFLSPPFVPTNSSRGSTVGQIGPVYQVQPSTTTGLNLGITNCAASCITTEIPLHSTVTATVLGSTSLTYINCGSLPFANSGMTGWSAANFSCLMLWQ